MNEQLKNNLYFYIFNIYILMIILIPKSISTIAGLIPVRLMLSGILLLTLFYYLLKRKLPLNNKSIKPYVIIYFIFLVTTIPSFFVTKNMIISLYTLMKFILFFCIFIFVLKIDFSKEQYKVLIRTFVVGILIVTIYGLIEYFFLPNIFKIGIEKYAGARGRASSTFFNTIYFGIFINLLFPFILYIFSKRENKKTILLYGTLFVLMYLSIIHTFTRSSLLVFFGMLFLMLIFMPKIFTKLKIYILFIIILLITTVTPGSSELFKVSLYDGLSLFSNKIKNILPEKCFNQIVIDHTNNEIDNNFIAIPPQENEEKTPLPSDSENIDYSLVHRKEFSIIAKRITRDNLFTGVGFGAYIDYMNSKDFANKYPDYIYSKTHPHSATTLICSEIGILGVMSFSMFIGYIFMTNVISTLKIKNKKNVDKKNINLLIVIIILGFIFVNVIAENSVYDTQIYPLFLIIVGLSMNYVRNNKVRYLGNLT